MAGPAPQPDQTGSAKPTTAGVLPISIVKAVKPQPVNGHGVRRDAPPGPSPPQRLKVVIRRLPPGLTEDEFDAAMGDTWKVACGKVSWKSYRPGKVSRE